jgi:alkylation response protein AidB-like acyl-CoA dehydrogenase
MKGTYTENVDFSMTEEDEAFRAELRTWLKEHLPPFLAEWSDGTDSAKHTGAVGFNRSQERRKAWQRLLNEGRWAAINWPKEWNGREATPVQNTIYSEELARVRTPAVYNPNGLWQIGPVIIANGTEEQKQRWLPSILSADVHWCQGFSEPEAGSDLANMRTTAIRDDDHYVVNGQKTWTSSAHLAKYGLFLLRTDPTAISRDAKHEGITAFIIDMETPGIECRQLKDMTGDAMLNDVFFTDVRIPVSDRLGEDDQGWKVAMSTLGHERVGTAGLSITMAADLRSIVSLARTYNPDALRDPGIRDRIGQAHAEIELTKLLNYRALTKIIKGQPNWPEVPLAKLQWSSIAQNLANLALDVLGPTALVGKGDEHAIDGGNWVRNYSWQRYTSIGAGATEIQKNIIAKKALKLADKH